MQNMRHIHIIVSWYSSPVICFVIMRVLEEGEVKRDKREKEEKGRNICQIEIIIVSHHNL